MEICMSVLILLCILFCLLVQQHYKREMEAVYQGLLLKLDRAITLGAGEVSYDESMDAAVSERLRRILEISGMHKEKAQKERDVVQSLISDITHQVRTPLTNIMLYTGLLQEKEKDGETAVLIEKISQASLRLDFFMRQLVKSSCAEREMIALSPKLTKAGEIVGMACQAQELSAMKKNIVFVREVTEDMCFADKKWTIEAVANVVENAVKYSPENSRIEVKTIPYESFVLIEVKDFGIGIKEEERGLVFGRFYRSEDVKDLPGFGIGLYLVREIISGEGGYVKIKENPEGGTIVQVYLSRFPVSVG
ncbi:HAMP domain-containing sensor histidine kinase [Lachnospiraceae bacterium 38-14]|nr:HAMP domain-containing sensor histidine kinase [Lachnospiraceae bacterium]